MELVKLLTLLIMMSMLMLYFFSFLDGERLHDRFGSKNVVANLKLTN